MSAASKTSSVLKYSLLPQVLPRFRELFGSGFSYFAYLMAQIYAMPGLLPDTHPYLQSENIGRFGIRHVIAAATSNLEFKREKSDQILFFFMILIGLVLLVLQLFGVMLALIAPDALAAPLSAYFGVPFQGQESQDIAFIMLDRVFGVPGIFDSCVTTSEPCYRLNEQNQFGDPLNTPQAPWPFHLALHQLFRFYNMGLLVIAVFVLIYYAIVIAAETAQTGTPFGKRFNTVWAPIRLVVAIGLLVPLSTGLSSSQYIILYAAKFGSNMATNGWLIFNRTMGDEQKGLLAGSKAVGTPNAPNLTELVSFMALAKSCEIIENEKIRYNDEAPLTDDGRNNGQGDCVDDKKRAVKPYIVRSALEEENFLPWDGTTYQQALEFSNNGDILIRFGDRNECKYTSLPGNVNATCGDLIFEAKALAEPGAQTVQEGYYELAKEMWSDDKLAEGVRPFIETYFPDDGSFSDAQSDSEKLKMATLVQKYKTGETVDGGSTPTNFQNDIIERGREAAENGSWEMPDQLLARGWGGAGIWYNRIADVTGAFVGASRNLPNPAYKPTIMEMVGIANRQTLERVEPKELYDPSKIRDSDSFFEDYGEQENAARVYNQIFNHTITDTQNINVTAQETNPIVAAINFLLGTEGLFSMTNPENRDVHPLSLLAGLGKGLIESSVFMLGFGTIGGGACALGAGGNTGCQVMGIGYGIAGLGLTVGFVLFYVIPFLPFVYFFFAVGGWVKGIFEAMVGAPLWALGHLRIDGNGLPGEGAINGYYLVFEVFIRPILILFGFLGGVLIFGAMAAVLNDIWTTVVENVSGGDPLSFDDAQGLSDYLEVARGAVDRLFFTILYAIIIYMVALSSFKLIDLVPNGILRWMGSNASSFGDTNQDVAGNLTQYAAIGGGMIFQQGLGGIEGGFRGANQAGMAQRQLAAAEETARNSRNAGAGAAGSGGNQ